LKKHTPLTGRIGPGTIVLVVSCLILR
jgi:hypothetical protein